MISRKIFLIFVFLFFYSSLAYNVYSESEQAKSSEITAVEVRDNDGRTEIKISSDAPFTYTLNKVDPYQILVELHNIALGEFRDKITFGRAGVTEIMPILDESNENISKLQIAFTTPVDVEPSYEDNTLILSFMNPEGETVSSAPEAYEVPREVQPETAKAIEGKEYVGEKINIDFQDAELLHVFRLLADISGYNFVVSPDVKGKFSMKLIDVPWDQALDVILRNYGLSKTMEGNIIRIAPTSVIAKEEEEIALAKEAQEKSGDLITKVYPINYANVEDIKKSIETAKILTKRGFISADPRTSSVIIKDVEKMHAEYQHLIKSLDVPTPQVSIDARIVEVNSSYSKELGIQWGTLVKPSPQTQIGGTTLTGKNGFFSGNPLLVNLPATVGQGAGGSIGIGYISAGVLRALDIQLSALEAAGKGKIISNPKVMTMDHQKAKILQGKKIPYETTSQNGTQTQFVDAAIELTVTPHITPEGTILMNIETKKNEADFSQTSAISGAPTININEVTTQVLIEDGDTLALAGIYKTTTSKDKSGVPGLSKILGLGWLFKTEKDIDDSTELMVFITPRIVK